MLRKLLELKNDLELEVSIKNTYNQLLWFQKDQGSQVMLQTLFLKRYPCGVQPIPTELLTRHKGMQNRSDNKRGLKKSLGK